MILVDHTIKLAGLDDLRRNELSWKCTITNPKFKNAITLNLSVWSIPEHLEYFKYHKDNDILELPVGMLDWVKKIFPLEEVVDRRLDGTGMKMPKISFSGKLRDYQAEVVDSLASNDMGIVEAATGSGKTVMMIAHIAKKAIPTLILVNTIELANQFTERLVQFTNLEKDDVGLLGNGQKRLRPITVCLLQTMVKLDEDTIEFINTQYPQILTDETHIIAANTYYDALSRLNAKHKYGFSATPKREDGLTPVLEFATGPKIHVVPKEKLRHALVMPTYRQVKTDYYFPLFDTSEFQNMITDIARDSERNAIILKELKKFPTQQVVILCGRAAQVMYLHSQIPGSEYLLSQIPELTPAFKPIYKNGKPAGKAMKKKDREAVINRLNSKETRVIISTYGLFSTGIDVSGLEVLFIASPIKSEVKLKQSIGRVMRPGDGNKHPEVVDFVDHKVELLRYQANTRSRIINKAIQWEN